MNPLDHDIPVVVLTGGPGGGKTSCIEPLGKKLTALGYHPVFGPEAASLLINANFKPTFLGGIFPVDTFQNGIIQAQKFMYDLMVKALKESGHERPVFLPDRFYCDNLAYMSAEAFAKIALQCGIGTPVEARDLFCRAVLHLTTAALGAEEFYTLANNKARSENAALAIELDGKTRDAWIGHPHFRVIGNSTGWDEKVERVFKHICRVLGEPTPYEIENKYLCGPVDLKAIPSHYQLIDIEQFYVYSSDPKDVTRVRRRGQNGSYVFYHTKKRDVSPGVRKEEERLISAAQYDWSRAFMLSCTRPVKKVRCCFVYENQYFELDRIEHESGHLYLLEIELDDEKQVPKLPPFIPIEKDVTHDPRYSMRAAADIGWKP